MIIKVAEFDGPALLLQAEGRINVLTADGFHGDTLRVIAGTTHDVIIDATGVTYLSTAGIRAFLLVSRRLAASNRRLHICNLKPYIIDVFKIIGFDNVIPIHPDLDSALNAVVSKAS
jgi:anti-anti-sigma factor